MAGVHIAEALSQYCVMLISTMPGPIVANLQKFHIFVHSLCRKYHDIGCATAVAHDTMKAGRGRLRIPTHSSVHLSNCLGD